MFNYRHPHLRDDQAAAFMVQAFQRDFERNGPSVVRIVRTTLAGWKRYRNHPDRCVRERYAWEARSLGTSYSALVGAARLYYRREPVMFAKLSALLQDLHAEFGWKSRLASALGGRWLLRQIVREERRLNAGWTQEPTTFYERNAAVTDRPEASLCRSVLARVTPTSAKPRAASRPARKAALV
jgi:hypothetical protein